MKRPKLTASTKDKGPLQELGLSSGAEKAYLKLLETGPQLISDIARQSGQFRVDTYRHIDELIEHKLINTVKQGKRKYYEAASPESIFSILKTKEESVTDKVTDLLAIFDRQQSGFSTESFVGRKGIGAAIELLVKDVKKNAELLRIESPFDYRDNKKYYPKAYWGRASSKGDLQKIVITNPSTNAARRKYLNRMSKSIPEKHLPFNFNFTTIIIK